MPLVLGCTGGGGWWRCLWNSHRLSAGEAKASGGGVLMAAGNAESRLGHTGNPLAGRFTVGHLPERLTNVTDKGARMRPVRRLPLVTLE